MLILSAISFVTVLLVGIIYYVECKIIEDLPESNGFKKWWRSNLVKKIPGDL